MNRDSISAKVLGEDGVGCGEGKGNLSGDGLPLSPPKTFGYRIPLVRSGEDLLFIFVSRIIGKGAYWSLSVFLLYWNYM